MSEFFVSDAKVFDALRLPFANSTAVDVAAFCILIEICIAARIVVCKIAHNDKLLTQTTRLTDLIKRNFPRRK